MNYEVFPSCGVKQLQTKNFACKHKNCCCEAEIEQLEAEIATNL